MADPFSKMSADYVPRARPVKMEVFDFEYSDEEHGPKASQCPSWRTVDGRTDFWYLDAFGTPCQLLDPDGLPVRISADNVKVRDKIFHALGHKYG